MLWRTFFTLSRISIPLRKNVQVLEWNLKLREFFKLLLRDELKIQQKFVTMKCDHFEMTWFVMDSFSVFSIQTSRAHVYSVHYWCSPRRQHILKSHFLYQWNGIDLHKTLRQNACEPNLKKNNNSAYVMEWEMDCEW